MKFHGMVETFTISSCFLVNEVQTKRKTNQARSTLLRGRGKPQNPTFQPIREPSTDTPWPETNFSDFQYFLTDITPSEMYESNIQAF